MTARTFQRLLACPTAKCDAPTLPFDGTGSGAMSPLITQQHIDSYQADGAVLIKGLFADHVEDIEAGSQ